MSDTASLDDINTQVSTGFITSRISSLPVGVCAILCLLCVILGFGLCTLSPYAARWGTQWGIGRGSTERASLDNEESTRKRFRLAGGVLGIFAGGIGAAYTILLFALAVLSTQDDPTLSPWAILAISLVSAAVGGILGGRWKAVSRLMLTYIGSISLTLLFTVSFKIDGKLGRIIIFLIILLLSLVVSFIFSLVARATLQTLSNRISFFLAASTGAWLVFGIGLDIFVKSGLLDAPTLLVSQKGVFDQGPMENEEMERQRDNVVNWNVGKCKGLIAAIWLVISAGTAFQQWRYSVIGDDPDESWNSYLGALLSNEKNSISQSRNPKGGNLTGAGIFTPRLGWWKRLFMSSSSRKRRLMPATYMLPEEQSHINDSSTPFSRPEENGQGNERGALQGGVDGYNEDGEMGEVRNRGRFGVGTGMEERRNPPAKYDSLGYSTVGLGLYDDAREAYYTGYGGEASSAHRYPQGLRRPSQAPAPVYTPGLYKAYNSPEDSQQDQVTRSNSEPSFSAVPKYSPPRIQNPSILSGETVVGSAEGGRSEGTYMGRIVEEPEETPYTAARQPALVQGSGNVPTSMAFAGHSQGAGVPVPATPSLVNAIKRVSEAQAQARAWRINEQQQQQQQQEGLSGPTYSLPTNDDDINHTASPTPPPFFSSANSLGIAGKRLPESEMTALRQAAVRRQASAEWWSEVERKASEAANKERNAIMTPRSSSAPWKNTSTGPARY